MGRLRLMLCLAMVARVVPAQAEPAARDSLPGLARVLTADPLTNDVGLALGSSYGIRTDALVAGHTQHRVSGALAASYRHRGWLAAALELDGRYDKHVGSPGGDDDNWVGDPRLSLRARRGLGDVAVAGQVGLWFPADSVLSLTGTSIEARGIASYRFAPAWTAAVNLGARLDRSASTVADADALSAADRLSLGASDSHAVLLGAGVGWSSAGVQLAADWTWDLLVGADAPPTSSSPMRMAGAARARLSPGLWLGAVLELGLSSTPAMDLGTPLVPVEPKVTGWLTVSFELSRSAAPARVTPVEPPPVEPPPPATGTVSGRVVDASGAPLVGARVRLGDREAVTDADGRFTLTGVPVGAARVVVEADGFDPFTLDVDVGAGADATVDATLEPTLPPGEIRGLVRTLAGSPIAGARVRVLALDRHVVTDGDGRFAIEVPPGTYDVEVSAGQHVGQTRSLRVDENGVTVLNVELRRKGQ